MPPDLFTPAGLPAEAISLLGKGYVPLEPVLVPYSDLKDYVPLLGGMRLELDLWERANGKLSLRVRGENFEVGLWTAHKAPDDVPRP